MTERVREFVAHVVLLLGAAVSGRIIIRRCSVTGGWRVIETDPPDSRTGDTLTRLLRPIGGKA